MFPILYASDTEKADFTYNGLGFITQCTRCEVTEERNGVYELEAEVLITDRLAMQIIPGTFIKCLANAKDPAQIFEVYQVSVEDDTIFVYAQHIHYICYTNATNDKVDAAAEGYGYTPKEWWHHLISNDYLCVSSLWSFTSDIDVQKNVPAIAEHPIRLGDFFQGSEGSMLDIFHGEYHFNNFNIELLESRGNDTGICLRYGSNVSSFAQDSDITAMYTHFQPYAYVRAQYEATREPYPDMAIYQNLIDLQNTEMTYQRVLVYDFSEELHDETLFLDSNAVPINYNEIKQKLSDSVNSFLTRNKSTLINRTVDLTVDVAETLDTLQSCGLCDKVKVYFEPYGITRAVSSKIVKTVYDVLNERYTSIQIGAIKKSLADIIPVRNGGGI